jgi:dTDP-4-dehydrorhamnose 3,5-epimerase
MIINAAGIQGAHIIELEKLTDQRGFFARTFCKSEFDRFEIDFEIVQCSLSFNKKKGTLRGMHYQCAPHEEAKIVRCTKGGVWDVVVDLRPDSISYKKWVAIELNEDNARALFIPKGCAHGFQSLADNTTVYYQMNAYYHPESARGINALDPSLAIDWPIEDMTISEKDRKLPFLNS